jgi:hypothetical protein
VILFFGGCPEGKVMHPSGPQTRARQAGRTAT